LANFATISYMSITNEQLEHLALLSRLEIDDEEKKQFPEQLSEILDFIDQLKDIDTAGVESLHNVTGLKTVWREDKVEIWPERDELLASAPNHDENYIKTKSVFDNN